MTETVKAFPEYGPKFFQFHIELAKRDLDAKTSWFWEVIPPAQTSCAARNQD
jgi:hypothetical protein